MHFPSNDQIVNPARTTALCARACCLVALGFALTALAQAQPAPSNQGNFDPAPGQPAPARGARAPRAGGAAAPAAIQAHSPRDDQGGWTSGEFSSANPKLPSLIVAGDSTASTGDPAHRGWAALLVDYFDTNKVNLINRARGGRSFRTFVFEGLWPQIVSALKPGDFVVIEFGHNDMGSITDAKGRADLPGVGDETQAVPRNGTNEIVHTFGWYLRTFVRDVKAKGATPIVSSSTIRNIWNNGKVERGLGRPPLWDKQIADEEKVPFLDHSSIIADLYQQMGQASVAAFFPGDHTHTSTDGASKNAELFIAGLKSLPGQPLVGFLNARGQKIAPYQPAAAPAQ
jgi:lysophospholipase L1-like esterase